MRRLLYIVAASVAASAIASCAGKVETKDRTDAIDLFFKISLLTESYTKKVAAAKDSATWAALCGQFEDSLRKINFDVPADTDLLLSEGQNDTITRLMQAYVKARDARFDEIMHPVQPTDSTAVDSLAVQSTKPSENLRFENVR